MKKMNKNWMISFGIALVIVSGYCALGGPAAQKPRGFDVGITSTVIVPAMRPQTKVVWEAGTVYSQGDYIKVPTNQNDVYWCITAGTTTNAAPGWTKQMDVTNGSAIFSIIDDSRSKIVIQNLGSGSTVNLGFDWPAEVDKGMGLIVSGGNYSLDRDAYQGEVRAISSASTNLVTTQVLP